MIRHLGRLNEKGEAFPRKDEIDPYDSVWVVLIYGDNGRSEASMPIIASIWCHKSEALVIAERYVERGYQPLPMGFRTVKVVEYQTNVALPDAELAFTMNSTSKAETPSDRIAELEEQILKLKALAGQTETFSANKDSASGSTINPMAWKEPPQEPQLVGVGLGPMRDTETKP